MSPGGGWLTVLTAGALVVLGLMTVLHRAAANAHGYEVVECRSERRLLEGRLTILEQRLVTAFAVLRQADDEGHHEPAGQGEQRP